MKLLTINFLTCAVRTCKTSSASYPLHPRSTTLVRTELDYNPLFLGNVLPRLDWDAIRTTARELGLEALVPGEKDVMALEGQQDSDGTKEAGEDGGHDAEQGRREEEEGEEEEEDDDHDKEVEEEEELAKAMNDHPLVRPNLDRRDHDVERDVPNCA